MSIDPSPVPPVISGNRYGGKELEASSGLRVVSGLVESFSLFESMYDTLAIPSDSELLTSSFFCIPRKYLGSY